MLTGPALTVAAGQVSVVLGQAPQQAIRVEARNASMAQVLDEIAAKTGVRIHHLTLAETLVTEATCAGAELKPILTCLLGPKTNLMRKYERGRPSEIWVLGAGAQARPDPGAAAKTPGPQPGPQDSGPTVGQLLEEAHSRKPTERIQALGQLIANPMVDPATLKQALETALADEDGEVRAQAVFGLTRQGGEEAAEVLRAALGDSDADVRLMAVDSAGDDAAGRALLQQALADSDEIVREFAALKLNSAPSDDMKK